MRLKYLKSFVPISLSDMVMALGDPLIALTLASLPNSTAYLAAFGIGKAIAVFFESPIIAILHASNVLTRSPIASRALFQFVLVFGAFLSLGLALIGSQSGFISLFPSLLKAGNVEMVSIFILSVAAWPILIGIRRFWQGRLIHLGKSRIVALGSVLRLILMAIALVVLQVSVEGGHIIAGIAMMFGLVGETSMITFYGNRLAPISTIDRTINVKTHQENSLKLPSNFWQVFQYYQPLAVSMISLWGSRLGITLLITSTGQLAIASWAAGWALVVSISNGVRMLQQVTIRFYNRDEAKDLSKFSFVIGLIFSGFLLALARTTLGIEVLTLYAGSDRPLLEGIVDIVLWTSPLPLLIALQNYFQGVLMVQNKTRQIGMLSVSLNSILLVVAAAAAAMNSLSVISLSQILVSISVLEVTLLFVFALGKCFSQGDLSQKITLKEAL